MVFNLQNKKSDYNQELIKKSKADGYYFRIPKVKSQHLDRSAHIIEQIESAAELVYIYLPEGMSTTKAPADLDGHKYLIYLLEFLPESNNYKSEYYKAIFGDPLHFIRNHVYSNIEGLVVKESPVGYITLMNILSKLYDQVDVPPMLIKIKQDQEEFLKVIQQ